MNFFNTGLSFTPEILFLCKIVWGPRWDGSMNFDIPISIRTGEIDFKVEEPWDTEKYLNSRRSRMAKTVTF